MQPLCISFIDIHDSGFKFSELEMSEQSCKVLFFVVKLTLILHRARPVHPPRVLHFLSKCKGNRLEYERSGLADNQRLEARPACDANEVDSCGVVLSLCKYVCKLDFGLSTEKEEWSIDFRLRYVVSSSILLVGWEAEVRKR